MLYGKKSGIDIYPWWKNKFIEGSGSGGWMLRAQSKRKNGEDSEREKSRKKGGDGKIRERKIQKDPHQRKETHTFTGNEKKKTDELMEAILNQCL